MGDRVGREVLTEPGAAGGWGDWGYWAMLALPAAVIHAALAALGLGVLRSAAAVVPCALYVADVLWLRPAVAPAPAAERQPEPVHRWL